MGYGSEDELLLATTGLREEVHGPWHQFVYEHGRHVSALTGPAYVRYRPKADIASAGVSSLGIGFRAVWPNRSVIEIHCVWIRVGCQRCSHKLQPRETY